ncbi:hypothetical protein TeGR_g1814 [Tetraparma gracilis]|uniref:Uncharacterized protein n=1 Tax=Tetraparma gracilis TaxID=2962635 RepID=A0ABQ6N797_9STRA|nr:hypothetical protein TeGR_g1814 [Tetraparma gracilis]
MAKRPPASRSLYVSRAKTSEQSAKTLASLDDVPATNKLVAARRLAEGMGGLGFEEALERFAMDKQFGLGLGPSDKAELLRLFKIEHRKNVKKLQLNEIETQLAKAEAFKGE